MKSSAEDLRSEAARHWQHGGRGAASRRLHLPPGAIGLVHRRPLPGACRLLCGVPAAQTRPCRTRSAAFLGDADRAAAELASATRRPTAPFVGASWTARHPPATKPESGCLPRPPKAAISSPPDVPAREATPCSPTQRGGGRPRS